MSASDDGMPPAPRRRPLRPEEAGRRCPLTLETLKIGSMVAECGECKAIHDDVAWLENEGCSTLGCRCAPNVRRDHPESVVRVDLAPPARDDERIVIRFGDGDGPRRGAPISPIAPSSSGSPASPSAPVGTPIQPVRPTPAPASPQPPSLPVTERSREGAAVPPALPMRSPPSPPSLPSHARLESPPPPPPPPPLPWVAGSGWSGASQAPPPPPPPPPPPHRVAAPRISDAGVKRVIGEGESGRRCPYSMEPLMPGAAAIECKHCGQVLLEQAWIENGGCTTYGCAGAPDFRKDVP